MILRMEEYFFSVCLEEGAIQAAIWTIQDKAARVMCVSNSVNWEDEESLVEGADSALSSCAENLPENAKEPSRTVFGVPPSWVSDGQIIREHLDKIRLLCNKLSLSPTGFVVLPEAIAHFEKSQEKAPINAVIIGIHPQNIDVSIYRLGSFSGTVNVARSMDIADDVIEGLARFGSHEPIPSRFLIYDSKMGDLEETKQSLIKTDWETNGEKIKFLHTPKVEIVDPKEKMVAVSLAGASEIAQTSVVTFDAISHAKQTSEEASVSNSNVSNLGDVVDPSTLGFSVGTDVASTPLSQPIINRPKIDFNVSGEINKGIGDIKKVARGNFIFIVCVTLLLALIGLGAAWWVVPKAQITIIVSPKKIEGHQKVVFDQNAANIDFSKHVLPAKNVSTDVTGDKTKTTTGTKTIGTSSKGTVTSGRLQFQREQY